MKTHVLRINVNNLKAEIENNYFKYKDIFYKCLVVNLCMYNIVKENILPNVIMEDGQYNQYLVYLAGKNLPLDELIAEIDLVQYMPIFLDMAIYLDEFIDMRYNPYSYNLFSLTIDDSGHVSVFNKNVKKQGHVN